MADQAWRDRCARAMGWVVIEGEPAVCSGKKIEWLNIDKWRPDESYDQAMMMRDRCQLAGCALTTAPKGQGETK